MMRPATPDDAEAVATVLIVSRRAFLPFAPSAHPEPAVRQWVRDSLLSSQGVTVWAEGQAVVGVLATSSGPSERWIDQLYLLPGWTERGIGTQLLQHAHRTLARPIHLFTFQQNTGARRFYERHGYRAVAFSDGQGNEERCPDVLYVLAPCPPEATAAGLAGQPS